MSIDTIRTQVTASIWQAIAQSSINLTAISKDDQEKLVRKIADSMLATFDEVLGEQYKSAVPQKNAPDDDPDTEDEKIIWEGRPFLSLVESYIITSERIKTITGLVSRQVENYELIRIQDIDFKQNVRERVLGLGDIAIQGHDASDPSIVLRNVANPEEVYELLRKAWLEARKRYGLQFREYM